MESSTGKSSLAESSQRNFEGLNFSWNQLGITLFFTFCQFHQKIHMCFSQMKIMHKRLYVKNWWVWFFTPVWNSLYKSLKLQDILLFLVKYNYVLWSETAACCCWILVVGFGFGFFFALYKFVFYQSYGCFLGFFWFFFWKDKSIFLLQSSMRVSLAGLLVFFRTSKICVLVSESSKLSFKTYLQVTSSPSMFSSKDISFP